MKKKNVFELTNSIKEKDGHIGEIVTLELFKNGKGVHKGFFGGGTYSQEEGPQKAAR